jgi:hypothetical protein
MTNKDKLRNVLNIIFMVLAVIGVIYYLTKDRMTGTYIILIAMCFKIAESSLRMLNNRGE